MITRTQHLIDALATEGYAIDRESLSEAEATGLRNELRDRLAAGQFRPARIGQSHQPNAGHEVRDEIRNDEICWLEPTDLRPAETLLFERLERLRLAFNQELYLGLKTFEAHYARYDIGHFYQRHVDRFQNDDARVISVILYLNESWHERDGGQLCIYPPGSSMSEGSQPLIILPASRTLVCFTSAETEHEVRPSKTRERLSLAAWFRR